MSKKDSHTKKIKKENTSYRFIDKMNNGKLVFIIEQERLIGLDLQRELENSGYIAHRPLSLVDTDAIIRDNTPDLIIADTSIQQQMDFERMKKYFVRHQLPFICIGDVTHDALKEFEGVNVIGFFSKPFDSKKIVALVDKHFDNSKKQ